MNNLFTREQLMEMNKAAYGALLSNSDLSYRDYPLNVGVSKMNKSQLIAHTKLMENTRHKLMGNKHLIN